MVTNDQPILEPLVPFGHVAGLTQRIKQVTDILVLPHRQAMLVAKQAAEVDVLSGGPTETPAQR